MTYTFTVTPYDSGYALCANGKVMVTPGKKPLIVPTQSLAEAIAAEWQAQGKYNPTKMTLTSLAYTAIDRIEGQEASIVEALLVYVDTDTLSYRAQAPEKLASLQRAEWDPVLIWVGSRLDAAWQTTSGVMPMDQSPLLHKALGNYLASLDAMRLSACCVLASGYSSLALAFAVVEKHVDAEEGFRLSRLEEESQAEQWGRDEEAEERAGRSKNEIVAAGRFLRLLESA